MKERPILFSAPMVRALLDGSKTQTRRAWRVQPPAGVSVGWVPGQSATPYGQPGDRLWVREAFRFPASLDKLSPSAVGEKALDAGYRTPWAPTQYEADKSRTGQWRGFDTPPTETVPGKLRPAMFMPRWASRIALEITGVRVERLQSIGEVDCRAEGAPGGHGVIPGYAYNATPVEHYRHIWVAINGAGSWDANPWVWVVEFKRLPA